MSMIDRNIKFLIRAPLAVAAFAALGLGLYVAVNVRAPAGPSGASLEGCRELAAGSIVESQAFTPYEDRVSHIPDFAINPDGRPSVTIEGQAPVTLDGLPVVWAGAARGANAEVFYFAGTIDTKMTRPALYKAGGISELTFPYDPEAGDYVTNLQYELGDRVTIVKVGNFDGALTWGDPMSNGVRPHELSWVSDGLVHAIIGVRAPEAMVNLGRGMAC